MPLDETISPGQTGHIDDHEAIAVAVNALGSGTNVAVDSYGAVGDGVTDDTAAIKLALASGKNVEFVAGAVYLYSGRLSVSTVGQRIIGNGATLKRAAQVTTTTTSAIVSGATYAITVASTTGLAVGKEIVLEEAGVYDTSSRRITDITGLVVTVSTAFEITSASGTVNVYTSHYGIWIEAAGVRVEGLNFDGNRANYTFERWENTVELEVSGADRCVVEGCHFAEAPGEAIVALGNYLTIKGNTILNAGGNGIHFGTSNHIMVDGNRIINVNLDPTVGHADGCIIWSNDVDNCTVVNNYCENGICGIGSIDSLLNSNVTIIGNTIKDCTATAIEGVVSSGAEVGNIVIVGNRIYNSVEVSINQTSGASATFPNHFIFSGNYLVNTTIEVIRARYVIIADNLIEDAGDIVAEEISVSDSKHVTVRGNVIVGGNLGVTVKNSLCENVLVDGNVLINQYTAGLNESTADLLNVVFSNNVISNDVTAAATYCGILVRGKGVARGNSVNIVAGKAGINPRDYAIVKSNTVRSVGATYSIRTEVGSTNIVIDDNTVTAAVSDPGTNTVWDNVIVP